MLHLPSLNQVRYSSEMVKKEKPLLYTINRKWSDGQIPDGTILTTLSKLRD